MSFKVLILFLALTAIYSSEKNRLGNFARGPNDAQLCGQF